MFLAEGFRDKLAAAMSDVMYSAGCWLMSADYQLRSLLLILREADQLRQTASLAAGEQTTVRVPGMSI